MLNSPVLSLLYLFRLPKGRIAGRKCLLLLPMIKFLREGTDIEVLACPAAFTAAASRIPSGKCQIEN